MSQIELHGHFAVICSILEPSKLVQKKGNRVFGWRYIALVEIDPTLKPPSRIDPRIKSLKRVVLTTDKIGYYTKQGWFIFQREWKRLNNLAQKFDRLYPLHIMAREWPLALPVYTE